MSVSQRAARAQAYTAVLSLALDLPLFRSERKPVDIAQHSQQDLKTDVGVLLTAVNECVRVYFIADIYNKPHKCQTSDATDELICKKKIKAILKMNKTTSSIDLFLSVQ